jgi:hypothetical protein
MPVLRICLIFVAFISGTLVVARAWAGPFDFVTPVRSPLNLQGIFGLSVTLAFLFRLKEPEPSSVELAQKGYPADWLSIAAILLFGMAVLWQSLGFKFLSDDFYLVTLATSTHGYSANLFKHGGGTEFFRPVGGLALAATGRLFGTSSFLWHFVSLLLHLANSVLVFLLARRLQFGRRAALVASFLFVIHGTRPEAVTWVAGRFDVIAGFFVLAGLLLFIAHYRTGTAAYYWASLGSMVLAVLTKESAYAFPLLLAATLAVLPGCSRRDVKRGLPFWALAATLFAIRWWVLGGIGGYLDQRSGKAEVFQLGVLAAAKAAGLRIWSALYFPINWSVRPSRSLALLAALSVALIVWILWTTTLDRRRACFALVFVVMGALPALPQMLIGADLQKSRLLYLPATGFCLLLGLALEAQRPRALLVPSAVVLLLFHWSCLRHNLQIWDQVGALADTTCSQIVQDLTPSTRTVVVRDLPGSLDGVYFLRNGLGSCLDFKAGRGLGLDINSSGSAGLGVAVFAWDESTRSLRVR